MLIASNYFGTFRFKPGITCPTTNVTSYLTFAPCNSSGVPLLCLFSCTLRRKFFLKRKAIHIFSNTSCLFRRETIDSLKMANLPDALVQLAVVFSMKNRRRLHHFSSHTCRGLFPTHQCPFSTHQCPFSAQQCPFSTKIASIGSSSYAIVAKSSRRTFPNEAFTSATTISDTRKVSSTAPPEYLPPPTLPPPAPENYFHPPATCIQPSTAR